LEYADPSGYAFYRFIKGTLDGSILTWYYSADDLVQLFNTQSETDVWKFMLSTLATWVAGKLALFPANIRDIIAGIVGVETFANDLQSAKVSDYALNAHKKGNGLRLQLFVVPDSRETLLTNYVDAKDVESLEMLERERKYAETTKKEFEEDLKKKPQNAAKLKPVIAGYAAREAAAEKKIAELIDKMGK
jgi:hypothetical protein